MAARVIQGNATLKCAQNFDPDRDAQDLRKAMKGLGTDEATIVQILCNRCREQRDEISRSFKKQFNRDLEKDIKSEISGDFEKLILGLMMPLAEYYAKELKEAMAGLGTDEDTLIETLCTVDNAMIHEINKIYKLAYKKPLDSEVKSEVSGNIRKILTTLLLGERDESGNVDFGMAASDADRLYKAGVAKMGTDEEVFNNILCLRNFAQLDLTFQEYAKKAGHSMEKAIEKEFSGDSKQALLTIVQCITNKNDYFATRIHKSRGSISTKDRQLIRLIITRCEVDMEDIKVAFEKLFKVSLKKFIKDATKGDYEKALLNLINEKP